MSEEAAVTQAETSGSGEGKPTLTAPGQDLPTGQTDGKDFRQAEAAKSGADQESSVLAAADDKKLAGKEAEKTTEETTPETRAPEEYGDFALPEGMKLEGQSLDEYKSFAKEQDLTQEQAQKVLDFAGPKIKEMIEQPYKAWKDLTEQWWNQTKSDPEIGGTKLEASMKDAGKAFVPGESNPFFKTAAEVGALREALKTTGAMHHPDVQRLFVRMGKMLSEPAHLTGKVAHADKQQSFYNSMYPTMMAQEAGKG